MENHLAGVSQTLGDEVIARVNALPRRATASEVSSRSGKGFLTSELLPHQNPDVVPPSGVGGTANAIVLTLDSVPSAWYTGFELAFFAEGTSTDGVTISVTDGTDSLSAKAVHFSDGAAGAGDIVLGRYYGWCTTVRI